MHAQPANQEASGKKGIVCNQFANETAMNYQFVQCKD